MIRIPRLLVATTNIGKYREIAAFLSTRFQNTEFCSLGDIHPKPPAVEENGNTFLENAKKKAFEILRFTGLPTLADDSGLVVDALGGRPGVHSARFAGDAASDDENIEKLLNEMRSVPHSKRSARFVCSMVIAFPDGSSIASEGRMEGEILHSRRGSGGFGYDPIFYIPELGRTLAELSLDEKNQRSHRANALQQLLDLL